jgi:hypothetical protein
LYLTLLVAKVEWVNPHAHFYTTSKTPRARSSTGIDGPRSCRFDETEPVKEGDMVTVTGSRARDNSNFGIAQTIVFPDGHKLNFLSAFEDGK